MKIGLIGLGKMGRGLAHNFLKKYEVYGYDEDISALDFFKGRNTFHAMASTQELVEAVGRDGVFWVALPSGVVDSVLTQILSQVAAGATVVESGNSNPRLSRKREVEFSEKNIKFYGVGMSGGPGGALAGPPMIVGGNSSLGDELKGLLSCLGGNFSVQESAEKAHLAKILHNSIEYGMMQSIAEGVALYLAKGFSQDQILEIFKVWSSGSIIESRLVAIVVEILGSHSLTDGVSIKKSETLEVMGDVLGEAQSCHVISESIRLRRHPENQDPVVMTLLALMRAAFGGHQVIRGENS